MTDSQYGPRSVAHASKFSRLVSRVVDRAVLKTKAALNIGETMRSSGVDIALSPGHALRITQKSFPLYDRFLPYLAARLQAGDTVIDVGANCGDTLAGMSAANPNLRFVAIEPDEQFFGLLEKNAAKLSAALPGLKTYLVRSLVGQAVAGATLVGSAGTKKAIVNGAGGGSHQSRTLDDILASIDVAGVRLLKSDVDGFDYDVINSGPTTLASSRPLVFFESQLDHEFQREGLAATLKMMGSLGYSYWVLFDNFGSVVLRTRDLDVARQLIEYPWRRQRVTGSSTIYYCDVLAATDADRAFVDEVVDGYERDAGDYRRVQ